MPLDLFRPVVSEATAQIDQQLQPFFQSTQWKELAASAGAGKQLVVSTSGMNQTYKIDGRSTTIGRSRRADVALEHEGHSVSRVHARVDAGALAVIVVDLGSSKGTRVGSAAAEKVTSSVLLPGDQIFLGESVLTYKLGETKGSGGGSSGGKKKGLFGMFKK